MWIFGYGSLIWKADFPYEQKVPGFIHGHVRRFWQGSHDHRGTVENPGRVVTLIPDEELEELEKLHHQEGCLTDDPLTLAEEEDADGRDVCWGVAYKIASADVASVKAQLDHREKNGYTVHTINVYQHGNPNPVVSDALVYIGTSKNEAFLGPASIEDMARQVVQCHGASGPNTAYVLNLADSVRHLAPDARDPHLFALAKRVKELMDSSATKAAAVVSAAAAASDRAASNIPAVYDVSDRLNVISA